MSIYKKCSGVGTIQCTDCKIDLEGNPLFTRAIRLPSGINARLLSNIGDLNCTKCNDSGETCCPTCGGRGE